MAQLQRSLKKVDRRAVREGHDFSRAAKSVNNGSALERLGLSFRSQQFFRKPSRT